MRISDWSSDVCSSDLDIVLAQLRKLRFAPCALQELLDDDCREDDVVLVDQSIKYARRRTGAATQPVDPDRGINQNHGSSWRVPRARRNRDRSNRARPGHAGHAGGDARPTHAAPARPPRAWRRLASRPWLPETARRSAPRLYERHTPPCGDAPRHSTGR